MEMRGLTWRESQRDQALSFGRVSQWATICAAEEVSVLLIFSRSPLALENDAHGNKQIQPSATHGFLRQAQPRLHKTRPNLVVRPAALWHRHLNF
jgi:hypothetical protein